MKLKDVDIQCSKVYVTNGNGTFRYGIMILDSFGECEVIGLHVVNGNVYIEVKRCDN